MLWMRVPAIAAAVIVAVSCGDSNGTEPDPPVATTIALAPPTSTLSALGATQNLTATVRDQDGSTMSGQTLSWSSSATGVATVSNTGVVTAVANGTATITASIGSVQGTATVTVAQAVASLAKTGGDGQTGTVGLELVTPLEVEARDAQGNPVPGANVAFAAATGGGSVGTAAGTSGANGRLTTTWTLGTAAGTDHSVTATATGAPAATFTATATADAPDTIAMVSGDAQSAAAGMALPESLVVRVVDQYGNPVDGTNVTFVATGGGGSLSPTMPVTSDSGLARSAWTVGASAGANSAEAQLTGVTGSPVMFTATGTNLVLDSITPDTLVEGASATLHGAGFDLTAANDTVRVDGVIATVTAAFADSVQITVPAGVCSPARDVDVDVRIGAISTNTLSHPLRPATYVSLAVGEQQIIRDPALFCAQFGATAADEQYLIGVQSTGETPSNVTSARLIAASPSPAPPAMVSAGPRTASQFATATPSPRMERLRAHRSAEQEIRAFDERHLRTTPRPAADRSAMAAMIVDSTVSVDDTLHTIRVQDGSASCNGFDSISVVVRAKGLRSIWLEDLANPANGYTQADYDSLSLWMDNVIFDTDTSYFGNPGDRDGNARVVIVVTREVNLRSAGLLGFVISCDFYPRQSGTLSSNDGEFFYAKAPDPTGANGSTYSRADAFEDAPFLIAHEFSHIIQFGRRIPAGGAFSSWLFEGQATLAEEVVGHVVTGRAPLNNYDYAVAFNSPANTEIDWYSNAFGDLGWYFGAVTTSTQLSSAPHECTWVGRTDEGNSGPCNNGRAVYGTPWALYRWVSDQFGPGFAGGEQGLHKAVIGNTAAGMTNLAAVVGVSVDTLLAQWAAALYVDDRVPGASARLTIPSWDFVDVFGGMFVSQRLNPTSVSYGAFDLSRNVRDGSTAYFVIGGGNRPATAVRARSGADGELGSPMRFWIVRLQ